MIPHMESSRKNMQKNGKINAGSEAQYGPCLVGTILQSLVERSHHPLAGAYQLYVHTEPCVDLKIISPTPGSMPLGEHREGTLVHDEEGHFCFVQEKEREQLAPTHPLSATPAPLVTPRNPIIYRGTYINVHRAKDGTLYPTFCRPLLNDGFTIADFCREAACELFDIARRVEKWMPGMSA